MPCHNYDQLDLGSLISRRELFRHTSSGITGIALGSLLLNESSTAEMVRRSHYPGKARAVIQLFQHGGPSHMDLFDPKPTLNKHDGKPMPESFKDLVQISQHGGLMGTPFKFRPAGQCGVEYSEIIPHTARHADDIAVIRSMYTEHNNHEQALWMMHTGRTVSGRPTIGAWVSYALGSENSNLPEYVVLRNDSQLPVDGMRNWSAGFLPPRYQGVHFRHSGTPVMYLNPSPGVSDPVQRLRLDLLQTLNAKHKESHPGIASELQARIASYELAGRMQVSATAAFDFSKETRETHQLYGLDNEQTASYGTRLLLARRLVEHGVRFVQVLIRGQMWDTHQDNANRTKQCCLETDQPTAALLQDLKRRGLFESTLVVWGGEFGRTPVSQDGNGRDHHKQGFSLWLAGGGIRGGQAYGATDDLGYYAVENPVKVSDLHATILHQLGLHHRDLTYDSHGRNERLTDEYDARILTPLVS